MAQATLEDDDLFGEAAAEVTETVEEELAAAKAALPDADAIWTADADNVLGVFNTLRTQLDAEEAASHLREARKWYTIGKRADAFEDDDLETEIEELAATLERIEDVHDAVGDVASTLPELRDALSTPEE